MLKLLKDMLFFKQGGGIDTPAKFILATNGKSLDNTIELWAKTEVGKRYINGDRITHYVYKYMHSDPSTFATQYLAFHKHYGIDKIKNYYPESSTKSHSKAFSAFISDTHDFLHVVTGYPTDAVGELARIRVFYGMEGRGWQLIHWIMRIRFMFGWWRKERKLYFDLQKEATEQSKVVHNYMFMPWFDMLGWHINKVRKNFNTHETTIHHWKNT